MPDTDIVVEGQPIIQAVNEMRRQADQARRSRAAQNHENMNAFLGRQDWSHKIPGQSREFLPKTGVAVEQFVSFIKKAITQYGEWYDIKLSYHSQLPMTSQQCKDFLNMCLATCFTEDNVKGRFETVITDAIRTASLEGLLIFKVHGQTYTQRKIGQNEQGQRTLTEIPMWGLRVDLVPFEDYYPDPTGRGLYEIQRAEYDLYQVERMAEEGIFDPEVVSKIKSDFARPKHEERKDYDRNQDEPPPLDFRPQVTIDEFWGTLLDPEGHVIMENCFCAVANETYVIREPAPNPFWHNQSPFVAMPLIRVPFSVWHKALYDAGAQLNFAMNELFNLMVDGALSSVWGIKQLRIEELEDPSQVSDGIPQGTTLVVKSTLPTNSKVLETVAEGEVPADAMAAFEMLSREYASAVMSNELKMGSLPAKPVKATEIIELSQNQATLLDGIIIEIEYVISELLRKCFLTCLQHLDNMPVRGVINSVGPGATFRMGRAPKEELFQAFADNSAITVNGVSAQLARTRDFQRFAALMQLIGSQPVLFMAFFRKFSPDKVISRLFKLLAINPEDFFRDDEEMTNFEQDLQFLPQALGMMGGGNAKGMSNMPGQGGIQGSIPGEINQATNPLTGLGAGGEE